MPRVKLKSLSMRGTNMKSIREHIENRSSFQAFTDICCADGVMSRSEEREAFRLMRTGDTSQRQRIIMANQRFLLHIAKFYVGHGVCLEDLIGAAQIGLIYAVDNFDETLGFGFVTYAVWAVRSAIQRTISENGHIVGVHKNLYAHITKIRKAMERLAAAGNTAPTIEELSAESGARIQFCETYLMQLHPAKSLDRSLIAEEDGDTYMDILADEKDPGAEIDAELTGLVVDRMISQFPKRTQEIIRMRFGIGDGAIHDNEHTLDEIGESLGLSRERIRQILSRVYEDVATHKKFNFVREACA